jgi:hypothetical protein
LRKVKAKVTSTKAVDEKKAAPAKISDKTEEAKIKQSADEIAEAT